MVNTACLYAEISPFCRVDTMYVLFRTTFTRHKHKEVSPCHQHLHAANYFSRRYNIIQMRFYFRSR